MKSQFQALKCGVWPKFVPTYATSFLMIAGGGGGAGPGGDGGSGIVIVAEYSKPLKVSGMWKMNDVYEYETDNTWPSE